MEKSIVFFGNKKDIGSPIAAKVKTSETTIPLAGGEINESSIEHRRILTKIGDSNLGTKVALAALGAVFIAVSLVKVLMLGSSLAFLSIACVGVAIEVVLAISLFFGKKEKAVQEQEADRFNPQPQSFPGPEAGVQHGGASQIFQTPQQEPVVESEAERAFLDGPLSAKELFSEQGITALKNEIRRVNGLARETKIRDAFNKDVFSFIKQFDRFGILDDLTLNATSPKGMEKIGGGFNCPLEYPEGDSEPTFQTMKFSKMRDAVMCIAALTYVLSECFVLNVDTDGNVCVYDIRSLEAMKSAIEKKLDKINMAIICSSSSWQYSVFQSLPSGTLYINKGMVKLEFGEKQC